MFVKRGLYCLQVSRAAELLREGAWHFSALRFPFRYSGRTTPREEGHYGSGGLMSLCTTPLPYFPRQVETSFADLPISSPLSPGL